MVTWTQSYETQGYLCKHFEYNVLTGLELEHPRAGCTDGPAARRDHSLLSYRNGNFEIC